MNAQQPGFWLGVLLGGAGAGAIAGLVPLFLRVRQDKTWLAVGGFLASVAGGMFVGQPPSAVICPDSRSRLFRIWNHAFANLFNVFFRASLVALADSQHGDAPHAGR